MKKEIKEKWIAALRSGEYKQGRSYLRINKKYCCLGVLCDIHDPNKWIKPLTTLPLGNYSYNGCSITELPKYLQLEYQLSETQLSHLMNLNDLHKVDFDTIADWIERNVQND